MRVQYNITNLYVKLQVIICAITKRLLFIKYISIYRTSDKNLFIIIYSERQDSDKDFTLRADRFKKECVIRAGPTQNPVSLFFTRPVGPIGMIGHTLERVRPV